MIGGKVLDASALAALVRGRVSAAAWFATARTMSLPLYLPTLALAEVPAVRPDSGPQLAEVLGHPSVVLDELDAAGADQVDQLLIEADVFDGCAGDTGCHRVDDGEQLRVSERLGFEQGVGGVDLNR